MKNFVIRVLTVITALTLVLGTTKVAAQDTNANFYVRKDYEWTNDASTKNQYVGYSSGEYTGKVTDTQSVSGSLTQKNVYASGDVAVREKCAELGIDVPSFEDVMKSSAINSAINFKSLDADYEFTSVNWYVIKLDSKDGIHVDGVLVATLKNQQNEAPQPQTTVVEETVEEEEEEIVEEEEEEIIEEEEEEIVEEEEEEIVEEEEEEIPEEEEEEIPEDEEEVIVVVEEVVTEEPKNDVIPEDEHKTEIIPCLPIIPRDTKDADDDKNEETIEETVEETVEDIVEETVEETVEEEIEEEVDLEVTETPEGTPVEEEEDEELDIEVIETPEGDVEDIDIDLASTPQGLPQTGAASATVVYVIGALLSICGAALVLINREF